MNNIISLEQYPLLEDKINRLIDIHSKKGFAVVSACRHDKTPRENIINTEKLKSELKRLGYSYTVAYGGGFKEKGEGEIDTSKPKFNEISFVVYNKENKNLLKDAIMLCKKFGQDDIYYQEPNGKAYWINENGEKDATFSSMTKNDDGQQFFTGFGSSRLSKRMKEKYLKSGEPKNIKALNHRFSGIMEAINPPPATLAEAMIRKNDGEVFVSQYNVLSSKEVYDLLNLNSCFPY